jgi:membrane-associated protease RseP (regulator of RpoE activity)
VVALGVAFSIALHEIGHLVPAKRFGVKCTQYMVGFGPTLWSTRRGETEYGLKAIPLGGYIRMIGMFPPRRDRGEDALHLRAGATGWARAMVEDARNTELERIKPEDADRVFYKQPVRNKVLIMMGGPTMNLVLGLALLAGFLLAYGPSLPTTTVGRIPQCVVPASELREECRAEDPLSPAAAAGLRPGDVIVAVDGRATPTWESVREQIRPATDRPLAFTVDRDGRRQQVTVTPVANQVRVDDEGTVATVGYVGVAPAFDNAPMAAKDVPGELWTYVERTASAVVRVPQKMVGVWQAAFSGKERDLEGPIGVVGVSRLGGEVIELDSITSGDKAAQFVALVGGLNLALFVFNLIPLLPLDGGHVAGALFEGVRRQVAKFRQRPDPGPADVARMLPVAYAVSILLISMSALLIYADIVNPIRLQ